MGKLEELKGKLKELTPEELEELKAFLEADGDKAEETDTGDEPKTEETAEEPKADESVEKANSQEQGEGETESPVQDEPKTEETPAETAETAPVEEVTTEEQENANNGVISDQSEPSQPAPADDDIPSMQKLSEPVSEEAEQPAQITADTGETIPVDYEQVIEGLNAKVAALEAENASLKSKVDGAFGYSAKPSSPAKVNRLYDDCSDIHIHR